MKRLIAALGVGAALWAMAACGGSEGGVVAAEGDGGAGETVGAAAERDAVERIETVDTEAGSSQPAAPSDARNAETNSRSGIATAAPTPKELSTGPILQWTEFDPGIDRPGAMFSTGDGRVVIGGETLTGEQQFLVSSDGAEWSAIRLPPAIWVHSFDLTGPRWAIAGRSTRDSGDAHLNDRVFVSDDAGSSWDEVTIQIEPLELPTHTTAQTAVSTVLTSGNRIVAAVATYLELDIETLIAERGLLPAGADIAGWAPDGTDVIIWLREPLLEDLSDGDSHFRSPAARPESEMRLSYDELGLSADQLAILDRWSSGTESFRLIGGEGTELTESAEFEGWSASGTGTDDGFVLLVESQGSARMLTSTDGKNWNVQELGFVESGGWIVASAFESDGTAWTITSDGFEHHLTRWRGSGVDVETIRLGNFEGFDEFNVGPAGLATSAWPASDMGAGGSFVIPSVHIEKDGFELRYNEPEGGLTLWDVTADEAVYVFDSEDMRSDEPPAGVRAQADNFEELTFIDPDTGDDLVTFTYEELDEVVGSRTVDSEVPEMWIGWSADGTDWGWQTVNDAFGLGDADAQAIVAVGEDVVIAAVHVFEPLETDDLRRRDSAGGDAFVASSVSGAPRWFIARVP